MQKFLYLLVLFLTINLSSQSLNNLIVDSSGCSTKLKQIMKPEYPLTDHQGYVILMFDIDADGELKNTKIKESMCVTERDEEGSIIFKKCPFFKNKTLIASKYMKFSNPQDIAGNSCEIIDHEHRFTFSRYAINVQDNNFILRNEYLSKIKNAKNK